MKKNKNVKKIIDFIANETGCAIQHNGSPCNTCFHNWAETELELDSDIAHLFWLVVLGIRGDYSKKDIYCKYHPKTKKIEGVYCVKCSVNGHKRDETDNK